MIWKGSLLADTCAELGAPDDYILYTINNEWQEEQGDTIFFVKFGVALAAGLALAVVMELGISWIVKIKRKTE